jgi:hypothetical protein
LVVGGESEVIGRTVPVWMFIVAVFGAMLVDPH